MDNNPLETEQTWRTRSHLCARETTLLSLPEEELHCGIPSWPQVHAFPPLMPT